MHNVAHVLFHRLHTLQAVRAVSCNMSVQTCRPVKTAPRRARQLSPPIAIMAEQGPAVVRRVQSTTPEEKVRILDSVIYWNIFSQDVRRASDPVYTSLEQNI